MWEHPARCAELWWNGQQFGRLGELHPSLVENGRAAVLDIDLALLQELTPATRKLHACAALPDERVRFIGNRGGA